MRLEQTLDHILENSVTARRIYGLKLMLKEGFTDISKWFLLNRETLKYDIDLKPGGIVLDIGAFKGQYTKKMLARNRDMVFWLYEPIADYFQTCQNLFRDKRSITVYQAAVSSDGRDFEMEIDGLRSRHSSGNLTDSVKIASIDIQDIFDSAQEFELLKMNIEGMEFECLERLINSNSLVKAKYLLIQFHNFEDDSRSKLEKLREGINKDYSNVWQYEWMWELWKRKLE